MSYIVLARKWRPQGFNDLVGQETVAKTLKNALSSGKIAHAYLFSGPRGVGKTSSARILAKALNCQQLSDSEPCGKCSSCIAITGGSSVDVLEIDAASNTGVDAVRELRETVKYAPSGGKYKIYIIDEVHMLSTSAFNALLKTLEEPPPHVIFIFATTEAKKIPATILSRCQHHSFRRISKGRIKEQLRKILDSETINAKDGALEMIAKAADGSMRDALTLLDQACSFSSDINEADLQTLLGLPETEIISNLSGTILKGDMARTLAIIKELSDRGSDLRQITKELVEHFRNIAVVKITSDAANLLEFSEEEVQQMQADAAEVNLEELTLLLTELLRLDGEVRNAVNPRYTLELGLLRTSFVKGMTSIGDVMKMLGGEQTSTGTVLPQKQEKVIPARPVAAIKPAAAAPVKLPDTPASAEASPRKETWPPEKDEQIPETFPEKTVEPSPVIETEPIQQPGPDIKVDIADKEELWNTLLRQLDSQDHLVACKLAEARLVDLSEEEMTIGFNGGLSVLADSIKKNSSVIEQALAKLSGRKIRLKIVLLPKIDTQKDMNRIKEQVFAEPIVQDAMKIFNSSLLNVKPLEGGESSGSNE